MQFENSNCKKTPFHSSYLRIPTRIVIRGTLFCKHDYTVLCSLLSNTFLCVFSNTHFFVFAQLALLHLLHDVNTINMWTITLFTSRNHIHPFSTSYRHNQVASIYRKGDNQPFQLSMSIHVYLFSCFHSCDSLYSSFIEIRRQMWNGVVRVLQSSFVDTIIPSNRNIHSWQRNT